MSHGGRLAADESLFHTALAWLATEDEQAFAAWLSLLVDEDRERVRAFALGLRVGPRLAEHVERRRTHRSVEEHARWVRAQPVDWGSVFWRRNVLAAVADVWPEARERGAARQLARLVAAANPAPNDGARRVAATRREHAPAGEASRDVEHAADPREPVRAELPRGVRADRVRALAVCSPRRSARPH